jgi:chitinase
VGGFLKFANINGLGRADIINVNELLGKAKMSSNRYTLPTPPTSISPNPNGTKADLNMTEAEVDFTAALLLSNYNISEFTIYNLSLLVIKIVSWTRCSEPDKTIIFLGWQQSWKIMNHIQGVTKSGIDFNEAAAIEYLGAPATNGGQQTDYNTIYKKLTTIQPGYIGMWFDWQLGVRCDNPGGLCPCNIDTGVYVYTVQKDAKLQVLTINFCPLYFKTDTLDTVIKNKDSVVVDVFANMDSYYPNQGAVWFHELLHVDRFTTEDSDTVDHITDIKISYNVQDKSDPTKKIRRWYEVYGPLWSKGLARLGFNTGYWTIRNSDSMTLYALAKYVQQQLGNVYPHLPLSPAPPTGVGFPIGVGNGANIFANGTGSEPENSTDWSLTQGVCAAVDDDDNDESSSAFMTVTGYPVETDFPSDYLSSWSSWAGLTPTTTTTVMATTMTSVTLTL